MAEKLWLDDTREPPDSSWLWARDVETAKELLRNYEVTEQSLDHDLGEGQSDGHVLVIWEYDNSLVPYLTTIHSWNEAGALRMTEFLRSKRFQVVHEPDLRPP